MQMKQAAAQDASCVQYYGNINPMSRSSHGELRFAVTALGGCASGGGLNQSIEAVPLMQSHSIVTTEV